MFERFTDRARRVVVLSQEEARLLDHNYIGTEHILLGLIHEGEGVAARALERMGINLGVVRGLVIEITGRGRKPSAGHIPFTPRSKEVFELSLREALQLGHDDLGTEHILVGLVREGEGVAARVLQEVGADLGTVRETLIQLLDEAGGVSDEFDRRDGAASDSPYEQRYGFRRGVRHGNRIEIAGTAPVPRKVKRSLLPPTTR